METLAIIALTAFAVVTTAAVVKALRKPHRITRDEILDNWKKAGYDYPKNFETMEE